MENDFKFFIFYILWRAGRSGSYRLREMSWNWPLGVSAGAGVLAGVATAVGGLVCPPGVDVEIAGWEVIVGVVLVSGGLVSVIGVEFRESFNARVDGVPGVVSFGGVDVTFLAEYLAESGIF